jgi:hypothetical protein
MARKTQSVTAMTAFFSNEAIRETSHTPPNFSLLDIVMVVTKKDKKAANDFIRGEKSFSPQRFLKYNLFQFPGQGQVFVYVVTMHQAISFLASLRLECANDFLDFLASNSVRIIAGDKTLFGEIIANARSTGYLQQCAREELNAKDNTIDGGESSNSSQLVRMKFCRNELVMAKGRSEAGSLNDKTMVNHAQAKKDTGDLDNLFELGKKQTSSELARIQSEHDLDQARIKGEHDVRQEQTSSDLARIQQEADDYATAARLKAERDVKRDDFIVNLEMEVGLI